MFQTVKVKFDLYADSIVQIATQAINSPKAGPIAGAFAGTVWYADISGAAGAVAGILACIGAGISILVALERRIYDIRQRRLAIRLQKMEIKRLANYMKKKGDS